MSDRMTFALQYAARGWHVLPLKQRDKIPLTPNGVKDATTDPETIRKWWERWPNANIGIACGPSRLLVVDLDGPEAMAAWADLAQRLGIRYDTLTAHTGGGGIHLIYRVPDGLRLGNSAGRLGPHIDTRGEGGYIVAPPSIHPSGRPYIWEDPDREILDLPQPLADLLTRPKPEAPPPSPPPARQRKLHPYAEAALREEVEEVRRAPVGTRNNTLNRAAFSLGQLVGAGILDRQTVEEELAAAARAAGLEEREIQATLRSGLEAGMRQPRILPERNGNLQELISQVAQLDGDLRDAAFERDLLPRLAELPPIPRDRYIRQAAATLNIPENTIRRLVISHLDGADRYTVRDGCICAVRDGLARPLCNFTAEIIEDVARDDGENFSRYFTITGRLADGTPLPTIRVESGRFDKMTWVSELWGTRAVVRAGPQVRDQLREAIQLRSAPIQRRIYTHTGWRVIDDQRVYLTAAGALGLDGVSVELDRGLERYRLPLKPENPAEAMRASLRFLEIGPETVTVPVWAAVYLAPLSEIIPPTFVLWLYGMTGTFKSTLATLALSHYGDFRSESDADRRELPQWSWTGNRLEWYAFLLKDVLMLIDDYRPQNDPRKMREMEASADMIIRDVGNQSGRGRLNSNLSARPVFYPRGMILSTGEIVPKGLSTTARLLTIEVQKGIINPGRLTAAQAEAARYPHALAGYILWLADNWEYLAQTLPQRRLEFRAHILKNHTGHGRIPESLATLYIGLDLALTYAAEIGALTAAHADTWRERGWDALWGVANAQTLRVEWERPTLLFLETLATLVLQGKARLFPKDSDLITEPGAEAIGWYDTGYLYLIPGASYHIVARYMREEGRQFPIDEETLRKYLDEEGYLARGEERYTKVVWIGGKSRRVLQIIREKVADLFSNLQSA